MWEFHATRQMKSAFRKFLSFRNDYLVPRLPHLPEGKTLTPGASQAFLSVGFKGCISNCYFPMSFADFLALGRVCSPALCEYSLS